MEMLHPCCAGLDVHKNTVVACVRLDRSRPATHEIRTFGTTTPQILSLVEWLQREQVTHVAMEATGVYWKPVWHLLEGHFDLTLANARHIKNVPGRKSDVRDAEWIADLLAHGLIRSSFVPPAPIQEMRDLTRTRKQLVRERGQHVLRLQKVLEDANLKLASVVTDIMGQSGRAMLEAIVSGVTEPERLASLAHPRVKAGRSELVEALTGRITEHHRFMLRLHLQQIDLLNAAVSTLEGRIEEALAPFRRVVEQLETIPGVSATVAAVIVAETGPDLKNFPSAGHLLSWAGLSPGQNQSSDKRGSTRTRPQKWLKTTLVQAAWAAVRKKDSYLKAQFLRIKSRRGAKKAILAVAASLLTAVYHMLQKDTEYQDLGPDYFQKRNTGRTAFHLVRRLERLGYSVQLKTAA
ncbi:IS110 family transposase [Longimicrobium terrae]|uniref:IS110 family transposase n=1 Tax=Longimicrobium terrae TaxID=1639882 RepID=UPI00147295FB|nr:IS110 family transposase [Longimicrobium terrae]NNC28811.1 IS110 family transposase [Longimicrobium terrae]NNC29766.1 IS110 family transposase [Longimicrobium terrae]